MILEASSLGDPQEHAGSARLAATLLPRHAVSETGLRQPSQPLRWRSGCFVSMWCWLPAVSVLSLWQQAVATLVAETAGASMADRQCFEVVDQEVSRNVKHQLRSGLFMRVREKHADNFAHLPGRQAVLTCRPAVALRRPHSCGWQPVTHCCLYMSHAPRRFCRDRRPDGWRPVFRSPSCRRRGLARHHAPSR